MGYTLDMMGSKTSSSVAARKWIRRCGSSLALGFALFLIIPASSEAQSPSTNRTAVIKAPRSVSSSYLERTEQLRRARQDEMRDQLLEKRKLSGRLNGMGAFQPKEGGIPMLTNRTYKYRQRKDYQEIKIDFDPIVVPNRYRTPPQIYSDSQIHELVTVYSRQYGLDENLVHSMINVESGGNPKAVSNKGASGLMQLMPGTAEDMGVKNIFDPAENIAGGTQYIAKLLNLFDGNTALALAGYNAGPENVKKYGGIPPFAETQNYVRLVLARWRTLMKNGGQVHYAPATVAAVEEIAARAKPAAKDTKDPAAAKAPAANTKQHVTFKSGNVQVADRVVQEGDYYYIEVDGVNRRIHKDQVESVQAGEAKLAAKM